MAFSEVQFTELYVFRDVLFCDVAMHTLVVNADTPVIGFVRDAIFYVGPLWSTIHCDTSFSHILCSLTRGRLICGAQATYTYLV